MVFCTLFDSYYLDKGLALIHSLQKNAENYKLYVFCFDDKSYEILANEIDEHVILIHHSKIVTEKLLELKKERSKAEYCWTCTPVTIEYVLNHYQEDNCTYIDADMYFFSDPDVLLDEIQRAQCNIVITEHRFGDNIIKKRWLKKSGKYCVEFNYFDQSSNAKEALTWWKEQCLDWCYALYEPERMGDQKYLEKFPELFEGVHELQHLGGGVAPWNLYQYCLKSSSPCIVLTEKKTGTDFPLVFYHFQNIRYLSEKKVNLNSGSHDRALKRVIYYPYLKEIEKNRTLLREKYGVTFDISGSKASNKLKAIIQKYIMQYKIKSLSDIVNLDRRKM